VQKAEKSFSHFLFCTVFLSLLLYPIFSGTCLGRVIWSSNRTGVYEIWTMNDDGSDQRQLTNYPEIPQKYYSKWSPDGNSIIFSNGFHKIYKVDKDGTNLTQTYNADPNYPLDLNWSPDGKKILFSWRTTSNVYKLYLMDSSGADATALISDGFNRGGTFSPDGSKILFNRRLTNNAGSERLFVIDVNTIEMIQITNSDEGPDIYPNWSPCDKIIWDHAHNIWIMNSDGIDARQLTFDGNVNDQHKEAVWGNNCTQIYFTRETTDGYGTRANIWKIDIDGSGLSQITNDGYTALNSSPSWINQNENHPPILSPIGNKLVNEEETLSFTITATDPDNDALIFKANHLPPGATFDSATRTFSWTPTYDQAGNYPDIEFSVEDSGSPVEVDSELITITVGNSNRAPIFVPIGTPQTLENQLLEFKVMANDPDGDGIIYSAGQLPTGAKFNPTTQQFSWTPSYSQAGNYTVDFYATDNYYPTATGELAVAITVGDVPTPCEMAGQIISTVLSLNLAKNVENSYMANLKKICSFVESGKKTPAVNQLNAFVQKVQQDISHGNIGPADGNNLINMANHLIVKILG
jgi:hypothetical protein